MESPSVRRLVGTLYVLYGIAKTAISVAGLTIPYDTLSQVPLLKLIAHDDDTLAGNMYEYVFLVFALYTLIFGLAILRVFPEAVASIFENTLTDIVFVCALGVFLIIFYSLVLFTSIPIPKKEDERNSYLTMGLGGGISFIAIPLLFELLSHFLPVFRAMGKLGRAAIILLAVIAIAMVISAFIRTLKSYNDDKQRSAKDA